MSINLLGVVGHRPAGFRRSRLAVTQVRCIKIWSAFKDNSGVENSAALYLSFPSCHEKQTVFRKSITMSGLLTVVIISARFCKALTKYSTPLGPQEVD